MYLTRYHHTPCAARRIGVGLSLLLNAALAVTVLVAWQLPEEMPIYAAAIFVLTAVAAVKGDFWNKISLTLWGAVLSVMIFFVFRNGIAPGHDAPEMATIVRNTFFLALPEAFFAFLAGRD